ncbi:MAG: AAA family ATPase [Candidatus Omnitrophota bacterium]
MATVVSFINYKGGVGKTTLAVEISASLAYHYKKRVLLADLDPQTNATFYLMTGEEWDEWAKKHGTLKNVFTSAIAEPPQEFDVRKAIRKEFLHPPRHKDVIVPLDLLPSHLELMTADMEMAAHFGVKGLEGRKILRSAFENIKNDYDYIICDCPPNLNLITQNAILVSNYLMIVAMPEYLSTLGISEIEKAVKRIVVEVNQYLKGFGEISGPEIKGIIFNRVQFQKGGNQYQESIMNRVREKWPNLVFHNFISQSVKVVQSSDPTRSPIAISGYKADEAYEEQLKKCADEFIKRIEG